MINLFSGGSPIFMGLLSIIGAFMLIFSGLCLKSILSSGPEDQLLVKVKMIREIGLFAVIIGLLSTTLDLLGVFSAIEQAGEVGMSLLAGGLKYSMVTIIYGLMIYLLSFLIWFVLKWRLTKVATTA